MTSITNLSATDAGNPAFISIQLVTMDHYMTDPISSDLDPVYSSFRSLPVKKVPVLRVFGPTSNGQKACLHIHGILPYMFVPKPEEADDTFPYRLASSLDKALNISMLAGMNKEDGTTEKVSQQHHIFKIVEVRARPFYGYHPREHSFYKIYFYNPWLIKRAADILQNGAVMGRILQPHYSHIPYTLQFMMDYNLQGMNMIHLRHCLFRRDKTLLGPASSDRQFGIKRYSDVDENQSKPYFDTKKPPASLLLLPDTVPRMSISELEIDAVAVDILNTNNDLMSQTLSIPDDITPLSLTPPLMKSRRAILSGKEKKLTNPGLEALWQDERMRRCTLLADMAEGAESLSPPDSPPRDIGNDWKSESQLFWEGQFASLIDDMRNKGLLDKKDDPTDDDPDATANFFAKNDKKSETTNTSDPVVYPAELSDDEDSQFIQEATALDFHVCSLSQSILGTPEINASKDGRKSKITNRLSIKRSKLSLDDTIVDEEILSQTLSDSLSQKEEVQNVEYFDEDETELLDLLNELGKEKLLDNVLQSQEAGCSSKVGVNSERFVAPCTPSPSRPLTKKQFEDDVKDTLEMSQVWESDAAFEHPAETKLLNESVDTVGSSNTPSPQGTDTVNSAITNDTVLSSDKLVSQEASSLQTEQIDSDDFFVSSQSNSPKKDSMSIPEQVQIIESEDTSNSAENKSDDWDDDSFWQSINFENM